MEKGTADLLAPPWRAWRHDETAGAARV